MRTSKLLGLIAAAALGASCAPGATEDVVTVQSGINSSASCFNTPAASTFLGGGGVLTPDNYNPSTCPRAYMIELRSYSPTYTLGTYVAYGGATPTTQADCESTVLNVYVWRKDGTFLRNFVKHGAWTPDIRGVKRCVVPRGNIDYEVPGYTWGGDYKIGLQAFNATANQQISFATNQALTAATVLRDVSDFAAELNALPAGQVHPRVQALFDKKGMTAAARMCRATQLDRAMSQFTNQAIIRAGASSQIAANRDGGLTSIYNAMCTSSGTAAGLQAGVQQWAAGILAARDGLKTAANLSTSDASKLLGDVMKQAVGKLVSNCGLRQNTLLSFVYDGTLPAGKTGDNLLFGSCGGTPTQVAVNLGVGSNFTGETLTQAQARFGQCLSAAGQQRCNDPRADGAPPEQNNPPPPPSDAAPQCLNGDSDSNEQVHPCTDAEKKAQDAQKAQLTTAETMTEDQLQQLLNDVNDRDRAKALGIAYADALVPNLLVAGFVGRLIQNKELQLAVAGLGLVAWDCKSFNQVACGNFLFAFGDTVDAVLDAAGKTARVLGTTRCDGFGNCFFESSPPYSDRRPTSPGNRMCAPDFDTGGPGWYETDGRPGSTRQLGQDDRLLHCTCDLLDAKYGGRSSTLAVSAGCPDPEEKSREDCLAQPDPRSMPNPDASPVKPECLAALSPPTNVSTRQTKICNAILCGSGEMRMTYPDGTCGCVTTIIDSAQGLPCTNGLFAMCTSDDPNTATCGCPPQDSVPLGNDPFCQYIPNVTNWPGLVSGFSVVSRRDLFASRIGTAQFAMVKPNASLVGPTIFTRSLTKLPAASTSNPPKLRLSALISKRPPTGGNIDLQIYVTSRGTPSGTTPLTHDFAGQVRLSNLVAGTATQVDVPLFAGSSQATMLSRAFSGTSLNIEYALQAASGYTRYIGIGAQDFVGASTTRPSTDVAAVCLPPTPTDPVGPVYIPNPLAPLATPASPGTFTLSNGDLTLLSDRVPVLRAATP